MSGTLCFLVCAFLTVHFTIAAHAAPPSKPPSKKVKLTFNVYNYIPADGELQVNCLYNNKWDQHYVIAGLKYGAGQSFTTPEFDTGNMDDWPVCHLIKKATRQVSSAKIEIHDPWSYSEWNVFGHPRSGGYNNTCTGLTRDQCVHSDTPGGQKLDKDWLLNWQCYWDGPTNGCKVNCTKRLTVNSGSNGATLFPRGSAALCSADNLCYYQGTAARESCVDATPWSGFQSTSVPVKKPGPGNVILYVGQLIPDLAGDELTKYVGHGPAFAAIRVLYSAGPSMPSPPPPPTPPAKPPAMPPTKPPMPAPTQPPPPMPAPMAPTQPPMPTPSTPPSMPPPNAPNAPAKIARVLTAEEKEIERMRVQQHEEYEDSFYQRFASAFGAAPHTPTKGFGKTHNDTVGFWLGDAVEIPWSDHIEITFEKAVDWNANETWQWIPIEGYSNITLKNVQKGTAMMVFPRGLLGAKKGSPYAAGLATFQSGKGEKKKKSAWHHGWPFVLIGLSVVIVAAALGFFVWQRARRQRDESHQPLLT